MLFAKFKDTNIRKKFLKNEYKLKIQKYVLINLLSNSNQQKRRAHIINRSLYLNKLVKPFNVSKTQIVRRCLFTNRSKNVNRPLNLSRSILRNLIHFGFVPGYKKAVW